MIESEYTDECDRVASALTWGQVDTLVALVESGPLFDGDVPSPTARNELIELRVAARVIVNGDDGYTAATYFGRDVYKARFGSALGGRADALR